MIMIRLSTALLAAMLVLLFATVQTNAATATWGSQQDDIVAFGIPSGGGGQSYLALQVSKETAEPSRSNGWPNANGGADAGQALFGLLTKKWQPKAPMDAHGRPVKNYFAPTAKNENVEAQVVYKNAVNQMRCFFVCRHTPTQVKYLTVWDDDGNVISKAKVTVKATKNPNGDLYKFNVLFVADGYKWLGTGRRTVCENCIFVSKLVSIKQPIETPSPVPLPPAMALMFTGLFGLYGTRKLKKRG